MEPLTGEQKAAIESAMSNSSSNALSQEQQSAIEAAKLPPAQRLFLEATGGVVNWLQSDSPRAQKTSEIITAGLRGDQTKSETVGQLEGQGFAAFGDLLMEGVSAVGGAAGKGLSYVTPDFIEDEVMNQLGIFFDQPLMRKGKEALIAGGQAWQNFSQENPRAARNIEAVVNVAGVGFPTKIGTDVAGTALKKNLPEMPSTRMQREASQSMQVPETRGNRETARYREVETGFDGPVTTSQAGPVRPNTQVFRDPLQDRAIKVGFDEALMPLIRESSPTDRRNMLESLDIMEKAFKNKAYSMTARTTDVAGNSILQRYKLIKRTNEQAGNSIDGYARRNLKNQVVPFKEPVENFLSSLNEIGVKINPDLSLDFRGSTIEQLAGSERLLSLVVKRMKSPRENMNAYEVHQFKRFLDEQIDYGKKPNSDGALSTNVENQIKTLRREMDQVLDNNFPEYKKFNDTYAESISAMQNFQKAIGNINLTSDNALSAVGTRLRGLDSNAQYRIPLMDSVEELQRLGVKYGGDFNDNVANQVAFTLELDKLFGTRAEASFKGQIAQVVAGAPTRTKTGNAVEFGKLALKQGPNTEAQFAAMRELLEGFDKPFAGGPFRE